MFVSPAKHGQHIGIIVTLASPASVSTSTGCHTFVFRSITFEGMQ